MTISNLTPEQRTLIEQGVIIHNYAKSDTPLQCVFDYMYTQGYSDEGANKLISDHLRAQGYKVNGLASSWLGYCTDIKIVKTTPWFKSVITGLVIGSIKSLSDGKLDLTDAPTIVSEVYNELKKKSK